MDKLVVAHTYALGIAWDTTDFRNHGIIHQAPPGSGGFQSSLSFAPGRSAPGSLVVVPPSPSLRDIGAVRVRCLALTTALGGGARRQNLVEGQSSFAFFINPDLSLQGTFQDPTSNWTGIRSPPRTVTPNRWYQLEFFYDGISWAEIRVDGSLATSSFTAGSLIGLPMVGAVRDVGPRGIAIGHWAEPDDRYTFSGYIRDVHIWKRDEQEPLRTIDRCCLRDIGYFYDLGNRLRKKGYTLDHARSIRDKLLTEGTTLTAQWRGGTEQGTQELNGLMQQFLYALARGGSVPLLPSLEPLLLWIAERADRQQLQDVTDRMLKLVGNLPLSEDELREVAGKLCFSRLQAAVEEAGRRSEKDPRWTRLRDRNP